MFESSHGIRHRLRESKREEGGESEKESETATGFSFSLVFLPRRNHERKILRIDDDKG